MPTPHALLHQLHLNLEALEQSLSVAPAELAAGDLVQLRPGSDRTWSGMLLRVTQVSTYELRGYLLVPHRGGCRDAWIRIPPPTVARVGRLIYAEPAWSLRKYCELPGCARKDSQREEEYSATDRRKFSVA